MERKSSRTTSRGSTLPPTKAKRKAVAKPAAKSEGSRVGVSADVLSLEVEGKANALLPTVRPELAVQSNQLYDRITSLTVEDDDSFQFLGGLVREVKRVRAEVDDMFEKAISLAHQSHKAALENKQRIIDTLRLEEAEAAAKLSLARYQEMHPESPRLDGVSFPDNWGYEIVDESLLPRTYMRPDDKKILGVVQAMKEATDIPGVTVYVKKNVSVRT